MPDDLLFHHEFCLRSILIFGGFVSQGLYKLISEDFNIGSPISDFLNFFRLLFWDDVKGFFRCVGIRHFDVLRGDECRIGIAPKDSFVPHKIIVDEFSMIK